MNTISYISSNKSFSEWEVFFANLTDKQFIKMGGEILDFVADNNLCDVRKNNFTSLVTCLFAFAKYALEAAHFQKDLAEHKRVAMEGMARAYQSAGMAFQNTNSDRSKADAYSDAWDALVEYCQSYGYRSNLYAELCNIKKYSFFELR